MPLRLLHAFHMITGTVVVVVVVVVAWWTGNWFIIELAQWFLKSWSADRRRSVELKSPGPRNNFWKEDQLIKITKRNKFISNSWKIWNYSSQSNRNKVSIIARHQWNYFLFMNTVYFSLSNEIYAKIFFVNILIARNCIIPSFSFEKSIRRDSQDPLLRWKGALCSYHIILY